MNKRSFLRAKFPIWWIGGPLITAKKRLLGNIKQILILTNIITCSCLVIISLHYKIPQKVLNKIGISGNQQNIPTLEEIPTPEEHSGYIYAKETIESLVYGRSNFDIVMLGDSHTCANNWGKLLNRDDIANFGISGNDTKAIVKRIKDIYLVSPNKCFLMVGINDIFGGKNPEEIVKNYKIILGYLQENNIEIIIQSVLSISDLAKDAWGYSKEINKKVIDLNNSLEKIAEEEGLQYMDINRLFLDGDKLNNTYTSGDGIHLNKKAYEIWGQELKKYL
jgi:lysophospholipase L1-like esterase